MGSARKHRDPKLPRQIDELARLKVLGGPDRGCVYVVTAQACVIGRGEECDAVLTDLKASRKHVELRASPRGWSFHDLGSANGVLLNGQEARSGQLKPGDVLSLGETECEFFPGDAGTLLLTAPARSSEQVRVEREALRDQRERVLASVGVSDPQGRSRLGRPVAPVAGAGQGRRGGPSPLFLGVMALAAGAFLFERELVLFLGGGEGSRREGEKESGKLSKNKKKKSEASPLEDLSLPDGSTMQAAEIFFREGFREFLAGNYLRARQQFQTALQVSPGHQEARRYLDKTAQSLDQLVKHHLDAGNRNLELRRYGHAKSHFEAVLRTLSHDPSHRGYSEAQDQLRLLSERRGGRRDARLPAGGDAR
jgi:pSer/pThr/pTyr-binding forkhead associated (FHA) protein